MMKALKIIGIIFAVFILIGGVVAANELFRADLMFNPIVSEIRNNPDRKHWGDRIPLTPAPFKRGDTYTAAINKLKKYGFRRALESEIWGNYKNEINQGKEIYVRDTSRFPCSINAYVILEFQKKESLTFAQGTEHEFGCL